VPCVYHIKILFIFFSMKFVMPVVVVSKSDVLSLLRHPQLGGRAGGGSWSRSCGRQPALFWGAGTRLLLRGTLWEVRPLVPSRCPHCLLLLGDIVDFCSSTTLFQISPEVRRCKQLSFHARNLESHAAIHRCPSESFLSRNTRLRYQPHCLDSPRRLFSYPPTSCRFECLRPRRHCFR
jgi:hypothetical protein